MGSGDKEGKKGAQEDDISQNSLRKWKKGEGSLTSRSGRRKESRKASLLCSSVPRGAIEVSVASPIPDAASQGQDRDQGELWDSVSVTSQVSHKPRFFSESSRLNC